jgi:hypothetical protein
MKIGADQPGAELRCPSCGIMFVLGGQIGNSLTGTPELQAFQLIEEEKPAEKPLNRKEKPGSAKRFSLREIAKSLTSRSVDVPAASEPGRSKSVADSPPKKDSNILLSAELDLLAKTPEAAAPVPPIFQPPQASAIADLAKSERPTSDAIGTAASPPAIDQGSNVQNAANQLGTATPSPSIEAAESKSTKETRSPAPTAIDTPSNKVAAPPVASTEQAANKATLPPQREEIMFPEDIAVIGPGGRVAAPPSGTAKPPKLNKSDQPKPKPAAPSAPAKDFFLPKDFDPFGSHSPSAPTVVDLAHNSPAARNQPIDLAPLFPGRPSGRIPGKNVGAANGEDDVPIAAGYPVQKFEVVEEVRPIVRRRNRDERRNFAREHQVRSELRFRWSLVYWGLTIQIVNLLVIVLFFFMSAMRALLGIAQLGDDLGIPLSFGSLGLMLLNELLMIASFSLGLAAPPKNLAWLWALFALATSLIAEASGIASIFFPLVGLICWTISFFRVFFYLIHLHLLAEDLDLQYVAADSVKMMKNVTVMFLCYIVVIGIAVGLHFKSVNPITNPADFVCTGFVILPFELVAFGLALRVFYQYYYVIIHMREEVGWRIES